MVSNQIRKGIEYQNIERLIGSSSQRWKQNYMHVWHHIFYIYQRDLQAFKIFHNICMFFSLSLFQFKYPFSRFFFAKFLHKEGFQSICNLF